MKRKPLNLVLGIVALALVAAVVLTRKKPEAAGAPLTTLNREAITKITLAHPGSADIVLEKNASRWRLTAPVQAAADVFSVSALLGFANAETRSTLDGADLKPAELGLDPPKYTLALNDTLLKFGEVEPLKYTRYVEVRDAGGERITTIDDTAGTATDADYSDLISKALLPDDAQVAGIDVPGLKVMKAATGPGWTSVPTEAAADSDAIQKLVDAWRDAKSLYNQAEPTDGKPTAKPGTAAPETATVTLADGSRYVFTIVARDPQLVLARDDLKLRYTLSHADVDTLLKLPSPKAADAKPVARDHDAAEDEALAPKPAAKSGRPEPGVPPKP